MLVVTTLVLFLFFTVIFTFLKVPIISNFGQVINEIKIILFTFVFFSFLGLYDDISKILVIQKGSFFGLRMRHKLIIEIALALIVAFWIYKDLKIDFINIPFFGIFHIGWFYIIFAAFVIVAFTNAVNITDGLDGLASGCLAIALTGLWAISISILDTPLSLFLVVWIGGMIAFLYFNIAPARIFLGDAGALSFGAMIAVIGLIIGNLATLFIIGGLFIVEALSSLIQMASWKMRKKKVFPLAPLHHALEAMGWEEPKIVMRAWLAGIMLAVFGLWMSAI